MDALIKIKHTFSTARRVSRPKDICVCPTNGNLFILGDSCIQIFDTWANFISSFYCGSSLEKKLCISQTSIFLANTYSGEIKVFNHSPTTYIYSIYLGKGIKHLTCTVAGKLLVITKENHILLVNENGMIESDIYQSLIGSYIAGICTNSLGEIILSDPSHNRVQIFDKNGQPIRSLDSFASPYGVCVDKQDRIFVTDWGHSQVCILSREGTFIQTIRVDRPTGICLWRDKIIVSQYNLHLLVLLSN